MPLQVRDLSFTYMPATPFAVRALNHVDVTIEDGEFVGIIGTTGCGKSTLIQQMAGLIRPDEGTILLDGNDINADGFDRKQLRRTLGVVFQFPEYQLFEETVGEDVAYGPKKIGMGPGEVEANVQNALTTVGFDPDAISPLSPFELSGGQKRRVAIAGVLAMDPRILILDEPVAGLDPISRDQFMELVRRLNDAGITIIMISHNMDGLAEHASRILAMNKGEIILDGTPVDVFSRIQELQDAGLSTTEAGKAAEMLRARGFAVPPDVVTLRGLADAIAARLQEKR